MMEYLIKLINSYIHSLYFPYIHKIIKAGCDHISKPLAYILNMSLIQGIFPDRLKCSVIKPIYKNNDKAQISND